MLIKRINIECIFSIKSYYKKNVISPAISPIKKMSFHLFASQNIVINSLYNL